MARIKAGSPEARERARRGAAARWRARTGDPPVAHAAIASPGGAQALAPLSAREFEGVLRRQALEQERLAQVAKLRAASSPAAEAGAEKPGFTEGVTLPMGGGTSEKKFSGPVGELPGASRTRDLEVAQAVVSPAVQPAPVAAGPTGPPMVCQGCLSIVAAQDQSAHSKACRTQPAHEAMKWRPVDRRDFAEKVPTPVINLLRHHCGQVVRVVDRAQHRCPAGSLGHWGLTAEEWRAVS